MTRLLDPQPMSPTEIADLVERVRRADHRRRGPLPRHELIRRHAERTHVREVALAVARELRVPEFPSGAICALCTGPCVGAMYREPLGRAGALVNVCVRCATEPAHERDHLFGGSGRGGIGDGNRRIGPAHGR